MAGQPQYPALNLYPLNDSFVPKHILLAGGIRVKIGRQTNAKTVPGEKNGYFDSKVLSRQHAEVWEEGGKIYIKDVKSSNGTFINGTRLSPEGVESQPFELNTEDVVEFGIDIVGEDNQTIIHHKVAAKVQCILTPEDAQAAQQAAYNQQMRDAHMQQHPQPHMQGGPPGRRPAMHVPNHPTNLGQIAPVLRPNKTGLSFDVILNRLQSELNRSKETASELQTLNTSITDIHESLSGVAPPPPPPFPRVLPPVRQGSDPAFAAAASPAAQQAPPAPAAAEPQVINSLQEQLQHTQSILSTHVEKMHNLGLETIAGEHDGMKRDIGMLRDLIDQRQRELELKRQLQMQKAIEDDDDDAKSVATVMAGEQFHEDDDEENDDERRQRREELGRPRTPEPSLGDGDSDGEGDIGVRTINIRNLSGTIRGGGSWNGDATGPGGALQHKPELVPASRESVDKLTERFEQLAAQFVSAIELSKSLQTQQLAAQEQIASLQAKVVELESAKDQWATASAQSEEKEEEAGVAAALLELSKTFEGKWERQKEEWEEERARLNEARLQWEQRMRKVEEDVNVVTEVATAAKTAAVEASSVAGATEKLVAALATQLSIPPANGVAHKPHQQDVEFQGPPSPRSLSSDSTRARRKRSSSPTRSRSASRSPRPKPLANGHAHLESEGGSIASIDLSPTTSKFIPGALGGSADGRSPHSPQNGPRLQVRPKSSTEDVDAATPASSLTSSPLSRKSDQVSFRFLPRSPHTPPRTAPVTYPVTPETHYSTSGTPLLQSYFPSQTQRQQRHGLEREHKDDDTAHASSHSPPSFFPSTHSELHPSTHWLIIIFSLSFLLPQPVPYFSAIASASILLVGIAAYVVSYQTQD